MPDRKRLLELAIAGLKASSSTIQKEIVDLENELRAVSKGIAKGVRELASPPKRSRLSPEMRKAQSVRMRQLWAERRRVAGVKMTNANAAAEGESPRKGMSRAARKAAAARMKAYWAARRAQGKRV
jgi:hypothetical protein